MSTDLNNKIVTGFTLPDLPYSYNALEPFVDEETMHFHHDKHHATYVKNLNDLLAGREDLLNMDVNDLLQNLGKVPDDLRQKVKNNAGGVANHTLFWTIMNESTKSQIPNSNGELIKAIINSFESFEVFKEKFSATALGHFGSGWAWLVINKDKMNLEIVDTMNQDSPFSISGLYMPVLCLDVWEHAYYLKYKNMRADYIEAWWNVVNWKEVEKRFEEVSRK